MFSKISVVYRITMWYACFLLIISFGFLLLIINIQRVSARYDARTRLNESVSEACEYIMESDSTFAMSKYLDFYKDGIYLSVYDSKSILIEGQRPAGLPELPPLEDNAFQTLIDITKHQWYIYDNCFNMNSDVVWVRGFTRDHAILNDPFPRLLQSMIWIFVLLFFVALIGGFLISRHAFAPVRSVVNTARKISDDGNLTRRIPETESSDEINMLTVEFNRMLSRLWEQQEKEKRFTSDVSHELRTPISVILSECDDALDDPAYSEYALRTIRNRAAGMSTLINTLLMLSRGDAGRIELSDEIVDLSELCNMVAEQQEEILQRDHIELTTQIAPGVFVKGDEALLMQIFINLINNAHYHGRCPDGHITFSLDVRDREACIQVMDDGPGIEEEHLPHIFERFYIADRSRTNSRSNGLGLAIVKMIISLYHGKISVESTVGEGSVFTVRLPLSGGEA